MKHILLLCTLLVSFSFIPVQQPGFLQLSSLTGGVWTMKTRKGLICEEWKNKSRTQLTGRSYQVAGADTTWLENLELSVSGDVIVYNSQVNGQNNGKAVPFTLTESKDGHFVFSNPAHDFPQRIIYHFVTVDSVHAWIDGKINGKERKSDFYYVRKR